MMTIWLSVWLDSLCCHFTLTYNLLLGGPPWIPSQSC
jgi:hypothetical protein